MRYILRFCMQPGFHTDEKLEALLRYVRNAKIDDVMFFMNCEELFEGHLSIAEYAPWLNLIRQAGAVLRTAGVDFSLNPWTTILHTDRGRRKPEGWDYQAMVGPDGMACQAVACPLDEAFLQYLCGLYAHFATLSPTVLWVEDDFRLHNHAPLLWGGCFCPDHMRRFSDALGFPVSREEFVKRAFAPGPPNPYHNAWLQVAEETMTAFARRLGEAVRAANPKVALGLMSSQPAVHCVEMRDWSAVFEGLRTGVPACSRPHLPAYGDMHATQYLYRFPGATARTVDGLPEGTAVYPELENFPHSRFAKSDAMGAFQMELALAAGISGMTLNLFDMMGNGVDEAESFGDYLASRKAYLTAVAVRKWGKARHVGVWALYDPKSSATLHVQAETGHPGALRPEEDSFAGLLNVLGISCLPRAKAMPEENAVVAICGQYLRNLSEAEIRSLFAHSRVLLDGESVLILLERGLGGLVHAVEAAAVPSDSGINAYEQVCDGFRYADFPEGRISCQGRAGDWVNIVYEKDPDVVLLSRVHAYTGAVSGPGLVRIGSNAVVLPYRFGGIIPASQFTRVRQHMLQRLMARWGVPVVQGGAPVGLYLYEDGMLLANASMDDTAGLSVCYARGAGTRVYEIRPHGGQTASGAFSEDGIWHMEGTLPRMSTRAFVFGEGMA